jgi:hypothetical protein
MPIHHSKNGPIPDHLWENDPGEPRPLESFMTAAQIAAFDAETERMRRVVEAERKARAARPTPDITIERTGDGKRQVTIRISPK